MYMYIGNYCSRVIVQVLWVIKLFKQQNALGFVDQDFVQTADFMLCTCTVHTQEDIDMFDMCVPPLWTQQKHPIMFSLHMVPMCFT